ncbi:MAG: hypothetical protein M1486_02240, partial [Gammaproteobacteria bacterium]|nr:hypothetical protein [Gammaproteobacteria bacterium]
QDKEVGILVPSASVDALVNAVGFMLDHHSEYRQQEVAQYARDRYSHQAVGHMLDKIYREVTEAGE